MSVGLYIAIAKVVYALVNNNRYPNRLTHMIFIKPYIPSLHKKMFIDFSYIDMRKREGFWCLSFKSECRYGLWIIGQADLSNSDLANHQLRINSLEITFRNSTKYLKSQVYSKLSKLGKNSKLLFQSIEWIKLLDYNKSICLIRLPVLSNNPLNSILHSSIIDNILQASIYAIAFSNKIQKKPYYLFSINEINVYSASFPLECYE